MNKHNQEFANNLLSKVHYTPDNDDWIQGATSTVLSKEETIWIKSNNRLHRIESIIRRITDMCLVLSLEPKELTLTIANNSHYYEKKTLIERQWTEKDIERLFPSASLWQKSKHYSFKPCDEELYRISLVEKFERKDKVLRTRLQKYRKEKLLSKSNSRSRAI